MLPIRDTGKIVVLFSGGLDSTTLAHVAGDNLAALLSFSYGQPNAVPEMLAADRFAQSRKIRREVVSLPMFGVSSAMATGSGAVGPRILPGRNLVMLSHAVNFAASIGARNVWFGATRDDDRDYPDCRAQFAVWMNLVSENTYGVSIHAPFAGKWKREVVGIARENGVDIDATWSCYQPNGITPCQTCNACVLRNAALL